MFDKELKHFQKYGWQETAPSSCCWFFYKKHWQARLNWITGIVTISKIY